MTLADNVTPHDLHADDSDAKLWSTVSRQCSGRLLIGAVGRICGAAGLEPFADVVRAVLINDVLAVLFHRCPQLSPSYCAEGCCGATSVVKTAHISALPSCIFLVLGSAGCDHHHSFS